MNNDNSYAQELLAKRGRRCIATILTWLEDHVWEHLDEDLQRQTRGHIMRTVGDLQDLAMDMVISDTGAINQYWADELANLNHRFDRLEAPDGNDPGVG